MRRSLPATAVAPSTTQSPARVVRFGRSVIITSPVAQRSLWTTVRPMSFSSSLKGFSRQDFGEIYAILEDAERTAQQEAVLLGVSASNPSQNLTLLQVIRAHERVMAGSSSERNYFRFLMKLSLDPEPNWRRKVSLAQQRMEAKRLAEHLAQKNRLRRAWQMMKQAYALSVIMKASHQRAPVITIPQQSASDMSHLSRLSFRVLEEWMDAREQNLSSQAEWSFASSTELRLEDLAVAQDDRINDNSRALLRQCLTQWHAYVQRRQEDRTEMVRMWMQAAFYWEQHRQRWCFKVWRQRTSEKLAAVDRLKLWRLFQHWRQKVLGQQQSQRLQARYNQRLKQSVWSHWQKLVVDASRPTPTSLTVSSKDRFEVAAVARNVALARWSISQWKRSYLRCVAVKMSNKLKMRRALLKWRYQYHLRLIEQQVYLNHHKMCVRKAWVHWRAWADLHHRFVHARQKALQAKAFRQWTITWHSHKTLQSVISHRNLTKLRHCWRVWYVETLLQKLKQKQQQRLLLRTFSEWQSLSVLQQLRKRLVVHLQSIFTPTVSDILRSWHHMAVHQRAIGSIAADYQRADALKVSTKMWTRWRTAYAQHKRLELIADQFYHDRIGKAAVVRCKKASSLLQATTLYQRRTVRLMWTRWRSAIDRLQRSMCTVLQYRTVTAGRVQLKCFGQWLHRTQDLAKIQDGASEAANKRLLGFYLRTWRDAHARHQLQLHLADQLSVQYLEKAALKKWSDRWLLLLQAECQAYEWLHQSLLRRTWTSWQKLLAMQRHRDEIWQKRTMKTAFLKWHRKTVERRASAGLNNSRAVTQLQHESPSSAFNKGETRGGVVAAIARLLRASMDTPRTFQHIRQEILAETYWRRCVLRQATRKWQRRAQHKILMKT